MSSPKAQPARRPDEGEVEVGGRQTVWIGNEPVEVQHQTVPLGQLKLDPDNPRLRYLLRNGKTKDVAALLRKMDFADELFKQIRDNGGIHDPVHVLDDDTVVEGNSRVACLQRLAENQPNDPRWKRVPILRLPTTVSPQQVAILQGNFHVQAKNKWKAYAKAEHLHHMSTRLGMPIATIAKSLGMQERVVQRLIGQYEMMTDDVLPHVDLERGIKLWSHVDEFHKRADLESYRSKKANRHQFAKLLTEGKIKKGADVRKLGKVVANQKALDELAKHGLDAAVRVVTRSDPTIDSTVFRRVADTTKALKSLNGSDLDRLKAEKAAQELFCELHRMLQQAAGVAKFSLR